MKCPVCQSEGMGYLTFRDVTYAGNGMTYKKYTCRTCDTDFTVMYKINNSNEKIEKLVLAGYHIPAIKLHRQISGWGLKESKQYCDAIKQRFVDRGEMPRRPTYRELAGRRLR